MSGRIITYGTFDMFHLGHLRLLERARSLGDHLTVGVSTDEFNRRKGKRAVCCLEERTAILRSLRCVDEVILECSWEQKRSDIVSRGISIFVMGSDWQGHFDELLALCSVVYLPRTEGISTRERLAHILQLGDGM
jgi:glycerol-3-phosphate cytidylyltransferase